MGYTEICKDKRMKLVNGETDWPGMSPVEPSQDTADCGMCDQLVTCTHITGHALVLLHQSLVLLVHLQHLADTVGCGLSLNKKNNSLYSATNLDKSICRH